MIVLLCFLLAGFAFPGNAQNGDSVEDEGWKLEWNGTFRLTSPDDRFKLRFGGRLQLASTFALSADDELEAAVGELDDGAEVRRARIYFSGVMYDRVEFKVEYDFAGGEVEVKDAYIGFLGTPIGKIRLGHIKEPFSLQQAGSSNTLAFTERAMTIAFGEVRNFGVAALRSGEEITWGVGVFRDVDGKVSTLSSDVSVSGRFAWRPYGADDGRRLLQLGGSANHRETDDRGESFRIQSRPETHMGPRFVSTGNFQADSIDTMGLEFASIEGPFWITGEYLDARVKRPLQPSLSLSGYYLEAGYFLTGESRGFRTSVGSFDRVVPNRNFDYGGGSGAWEIAVRLSNLDLSEMAEFGGEADNYGVALNWYLNPVTRLMLNWIHSETDDGSADYALVRAQVTF